jgi:hypothetical protein
MSKTWKVSFQLTVSHNWIDDGFDLTPEILKEVIHDGILDYAYDEEKEVRRIVIRVVAAPSGAQLRCEVCGETMTPAEVEAAGDVTTSYATCDRCQGAV